MLAFSKETDHFYQMHVITLTLQYFLSDAILVENLTIEIL